jgi:hypothetical protein
MPHELPRLGVAAIVKNELDALPEWIAFHLAVGVSHFLMADNDSTDGTLGYLRELEALGLVTLIQVPTQDDEKPQLQAYAELLASCPGDLDLLAFVDADEFLLPLEAGSAGDALVLRRWLGQRFADPEVSALALHWACFGSAGERFRGDGLVVERFTWRASRTFRTNRHYKSVVRPSRVRQFLNPHHAKLTAGIYHSSQGQPLDASPERPGVSRPICWEGARVNHYIVKSVEEFVRGKALRGSAATPGHHKGQDYFDRYDRNTRECLLAREWAPWVHEQLLGLPSPELYASRNEPLGMGLRGHLAKRLPGPLGRLMAPVGASLLVDAAPGVRCELLAPLPQRLVPGWRGVLLHARLYISQPRVPSAVLCVGLQEEQELRVPLDWRQVSAAESSEGGEATWQATLRRELPVTSGCLSLSLADGNKRLPLGSLTLKGDVPRGASAGVLVGHDKWLFLDHDTNLSFYQHLGRLRLTPVGLERWRAYGRELEPLARRLAVRPLMVVAPSKERVMAHYHPLPALGEPPVEQALSVLPEPLWLYPLAALQALGNQAYQVTDTHWTQRAAGRVLELALTRLGVADEATWTGWFGADEYRTVRSGGDLGGKLVPPRRAMVERLQGVDHRDLVAYDNGLPNMGRLIVWENPEAHRQESCLVMGASSSYLMFAFLVRIFRRVVFVHSAGNIDPTLVERVAPDLLLLQTNARFMVRPPVVDWALDKVIADKLAEPVEELERHRDRRCGAGLEALGRWGLLAWHDPLPKEWFASE